MKLAPPQPRQLWKVVARVEDEPQNGERRFRWMKVRGGLGRGHAEVVQVEAARAGFRVDEVDSADVSGATFYPPHRIWLVEVVIDEMEVK